MKRFLYIGVFALLLLGRVVAQTPTPTPADTGITEKEKTEIREFTKDFLGRLGKTHDVGPLVPKYFAKDFETFMYHFMLSDAPKTANVKIPNTLFLKRSAIAMLNYLVLFARYDVSGKDFEKDLPPRLGRQYKRFIDSVENLKDDAWMYEKQALPQLESLNRAMAAHIRSLSIKTSDKYKAEVAKREKIDDYNYSIREEVPDPNSDERGAQWLRSQPDAKTYMVGTPVGLAVGIIRLKSRYKVLYLYVWPATYDGRLN